MRKYQFLVSLILILNIAYADNNPLPPLPALPQNIQAPNMTPQAPSAPSFIPSIGGGGSTNDSSKKPILTLTDDDKKALKELKDYVDDIPEATKVQIEEFEKEMKSLRAQSQLAYDKLSHEAKLILKNKKDRIEKLSEGAKKIYFRNEE